MKKNIGKTDRIIRIIVGLVIGGLGIYFKSWLGLIGLVPILTALSGFCLLYVPCKLDTSKKEK